MQLEQSFEVAAPPERVWCALIDVQRVAPCLPGAGIAGRNDDGSYSGTFNVKVGPTVAAYSGRLVLEDVDERARVARMRAQGTDRRGQGSASATIVSTVSALGEGLARVEVSTDYQMTGRLARFGRSGMIEEIANRLLREFAQSLREMLAVDASRAEEAPAPSAEQAPAPSAEGAPAPGVGPLPVIQVEARTGAGSGPSLPPAAPVGAGAVRDAAPAEPTLWDRARANPVPLIALAVGFLVSLRVLRRRD